MKYVAANGFYYDDHTHTRTRISQYNHNGLKMFFIWWGVNMTKTLLSTHFHIHSLTHIHTYQQQQQQQHAFVSIFIVLCPIPRNDVHIISLTHINNVLGNEFLHKISSISIKILLDFCIDKPLPRHQIVHSLSLVCFRAKLFLM